MKAFLIFFACLLAFMALFLFLTRKYINPYKFYLGFGKKGSGKTTILTKLAYKYSKRGLTVYCTEPNIANTTYLDASWIGYCWFPEESVLLIDEIGILYHSRNFKTFPEDVRIWFKFQRHNHVRVWAFSQCFDIDKSLRDLVDGMYLFTNIARIFSYGKRISKTIVLNKSTAESPSNIAENFEFVPFFMPDARYLTFIPHWVKGFKTDTRLDLPDLDTVDYSSKRIVDDKPKKRPKGVTAHSESDCAQ